MLIKRVIICVLCLTALVSCYNAGGGSSQVNTSIVNKTSDSVHVSDSDRWYVKDLETRYDDLFCAGWDGNDCNKNITGIKGELGSGGFDLSAKPIAKNAVGVEYVDVKSINYDASFKYPNGNKTVHRASGALMLPGGDNFGADQIKGVIVYFHPTAFDKQNVPSTLSKYTSQDYMYAGLYAAQGYIVVLPDYIGQGTDYKSIHPYVLYPQQNVDSAISLLNYVGEIISSFKLPSNHFDPYPLFSVGYSEGGAYSIWFSKCIQDYDQCPYVVNRLKTTSGPSPIVQIYDYKASVGMDGAYDLDTVVKPGLASLALISYLTYSKNNPFNAGSGFIDRAFEYGFYNMSCTNQESCNINGRNLNLLQSMFESHVMDIGFVQSILHSAYGKSFVGSGHTYLNSVGLATSKHNSIYALTNSSVYDPKYDFNSALKEATIVDFGAVTQKPIYLFSLSHDSVVSVLNTDHFVTKAKANPLVQSKVMNNKVVHANIDKVPDWLLFVQDIDHIRGENYANIFALNFINQCVKNPNTCK